MARGSVRANKDANGKVVDYVVRYDVPSPDGRRRQRQERRRTKKAADALLAQRLEEIRTGEYVEGTSETVGDYLLRWVELNPDWRASTRHSNRSMIKCRLIPHLGGIPLAKLTELHVAGWVGTLQVAGYAASTIATTHAVLHGALDQAVQWRLVARNAADRAKLPKIGDSKTVAWNAAEARSFLEQTAADAMAPFWRLALDSAMRPGELLGLKWADVDWDRAQIAVRRTITKGEDGRRVVGETTKRERSRRTIAVGAGTLAVLRTHKARQSERRLAAGSVWNDEGLVFDRGDGRAMNSDVLVNRLRRAAESAGVPVITPHGMRHTCATLLLRAGVHPKIVQERLGHATISETMDRYSHVLEGMQRGAADALADLLGEESCAIRARQG